MTNYERIQIDKAFCAYAVMGTLEDETFDEAIAWLDKEQIKLNDERAQEATMSEIDYEKHLRYMTCDFCVWGMIFPPLADAPCKKCARTQNGGTDFHRPFDFSKTMVTRETLYDIFKKLEEGV